MKTNLNQILSEQLSYKYKLVKEIEIDYPLEYKSGKEMRRERRALERKLNKIKNGKKR